jgi:hypothetical protein
MKGKKHVFSQHQCLEGKCECGKVFERRNRDLAPKIWPPQYGESKELDKMVTA